MDMSKPYEIGENKLIELFFFSKIKHQHGQYMLIRFQEVITTLISDDKILQYTHLPGPSGCTPGPARTARRSIFSISDLSTGHLRSQKQPGKSLESSIVSLSDGIPMGKTTRAAV